MKVDFYQVAMPNDARSFADILTAINELPNDDARTKNIAKITVRMQRLKKTQRYWDGDIMRIRMTDIPLIASTDGETRDVDLSDDEGIGEQTAFRFDVRTGILALQRNRYGVSAGRFSNYIEVIENLDEPVIFDMVLQADALQRLARLSEAKKLVVQFAKVANPEIVVTESDTTRSAIKLTAKAEVPHLEITMSMGHQQGSLPLAWVKSTAKSLFKSNHDTVVEKLQVRGEFDGEEGAQDFDLLGYRMVESVPVNPANSRKVTYEERKRAVDAAWIARRDEIETMFLEEN